MRLVRWLIGTFRRHDWLAISPRVRQTGMSGYTTLICRRCGKRSEEYASFDREAFGRIYRSRGCIKPTKEIPGA